MADVHPNQLGILQESIGNLTLEGASTDVPAIDLARVTPTIDLSGLLAVPRNRVEAPEFSAPVYRQHVRGIITIPAANRDDGAAEGTLTLNAASTGWSADESFVVFGNGFLLMNSSAQEDWNRAVTASDANGVYGFSCRTRGWPSADQLAQYIPIASVAGPKTSTAAELAQFGGYGSYRQAVGGAVELQGADLGTFMTGQLIQTEKLGQIHSYRNQLVWQLNWVKAGTQTTDAIYQVHLPAIQIYVPAADIIR